MTPLRDTDTPWYDNVLSILRAPQSGDNREALRLWAASEGMPANYYNWLATTIGGYNGIKVNSVGVKRYPTYGDGIAATVATLKLSYYREVVSTLVHNAGELAVYEAINASPWCKGCQGGHYPVALYKRVTGQAPDPVQEPDRNQGAREFDWSAKVVASGRKMIDGTRPGLDGVRALTYLRGV